MYLFPQCHADCCGTKGVGVKIFIWATAAADRSLSKLAVFAVV